jgi:predicted metalloprotease with PDZ domain
MRFEATSAGPVLLSLPAWTPGAYEISNFAKHVGAFRPTQGGVEVDWDKLDYDTWRVTLPAPGPVEIGFAFTAEELDNAMAWSRSDVLFVNGTNVFLYPEESGLEFGASVAVETEPDWSVATGMGETARRRYAAATYHDLVDMPFLIGKIDVDSASIEGKWHRVASYPAGAFAGPPRRQFWDELRGTVPVMSKVFGETPWDHYTTLLVFDPEFGGGSALEHQNSHLGIYNPGFIGTPVLASITAHEIFHAWNVKRLRPADLVPYRYDRPQPTPWLWVSEGITDYYADLALVRAGVVDSATFLMLTLEKIREVAAAPPVALEDASLSSWIQPTDGTASLYYPKGSLAGLLLDIMIRDASDNRASLDDVMRALYQRTYRAGRGFSPDDWWKTISELAGRGAFDTFADRHIDGREPFPWAAVAPLAGLRFAVDSVREPRIGIGTATMDGREVVTNVVPGSPAAESGIRLGDQLVSLGDLPIDPSFGAAFRARYRGRVGTQVPVVVRRDGRDVSLSLTVREAVRVEERLEYDRRAILKPARIRQGILKGTTERR